MFTRGVEEASDGLIGRWYFSRSAIIVLLVLHELEVPFTTICRETIYNCFCRGKEIVALSDIDIARFAAAVNVAITFAFERKCTF